MNAREVIPIGKNLNPNLLYCDIGNNSGEEQYPLPGSRVHWRDRMQRILLAHSSKRLLLGLAFFLVTFLLPIFSNAGQSDARSKETIVTIPLSILDVEQATATISVMEEPHSSFDSLLEACQSELPEEFNVEGKDISEELKRFCKMAEGFTKRYLPPPTQNIEPKAYVITVPLQSPFHDITALIWNTKNLDDAIAFVSLLQSGNLKAVKVYATLPWAEDPRTTCTECPIKELVFSAAGIKEQLSTWKEKKGRNRP